ncbi:MAG: type IX secretion system membrane protein PorP/SprF [Bacteroidetes bacterium]|nr:MAG: type IX secretion system membrane protein PorP/SprF [Bacteroidota bacterium]TAG88210.1 MAG: type IX secretion system membrane protein PorP/SprF [Bacteroidota bacterium]
MLKKIIQLSILAFLLASQAFAQDPQYSQYYAAPLHINPALAGSGDYPRVILNYRNQWPGLPTAFTTYSASFDAKIAKYNSGIGVLFTQDLGTAAGFSSQDIGLQYSYETKLNKRWRLRTGLQGSYVIRSIGFSGLIFGDQLSDNGLTGAATNERLKDFRRYVNVSAGGFLYSEKQWIGVSFHNINRPRQDILGGNESRLPMRVSVQGGMKFMLDDESDWRDQYRPGYRERSITPTFLFKHQGPIDQLDLGAYVTLSPIVFGAFYRGIPIKRYNINVSNHESIIGLVGLQMGPLNIGYSYDLTISGLGMGSGGAHEISLRYVIIQKQSRGQERKSYFSFPCPRF